MQKISESEQEQNAKEIQYADFQKIDLRVAKIEKAERVPNSEKLIRIEISLGEEKRQIITGIGKSYKPEMLVGHQIVVAANLAPRTLMGLESNGMLLAARDENGTPVLLSVEKEVPSGSKVN